MKIIISNKGFIVLWIFLITVPAITVIVGGINLYVRELILRNEILSIQHELAELAFGFHANNSVFTKLREKYGSRLNVTLSDPSRIRLTFNRRANTFSLEVSRMPRNAYIFLDSSEYVAPLKHEHLKPEAWVVPSYGGPQYANYKPVISDLERNQSGHFASDSFDGVRYWTGPRSFENVSSILSPDVREMLINRVYNPDVEDCVNQCFNSRNCRGLRECEMCERIDSCYSVAGSRRRQCLRNSIRRCKYNSRIGYATYHGQSCSNPNFNAMKTFATLLWDYYSFDSSARVAVSAGPIDYGQGWESRKEGLLSIFRFSSRPNPLAKATHEAIQNNTSTSRAAIDQDCVVSLEHDSRLFIRNAANNSLGSVQTYMPHYFISYPLSGLVYSNLSSESARVYRYGIRQLPRPEFDSRGYLKRQYVSNLTVREAIWAQVAKQRHQRFEKVVDKLKSDLRSRQLNRRVPLDIFLILGDFPWFEFPSNSTDAEAVDCTRTNVYGFLKVERTYSRLDRDRKPQRATLRPI
ncbi:MAG: hypothetical protein NZO16_06575, partial [Deltaproteobacteria bacterium]|nr:hypothetical protein [Deltaproteobacteria bacterium]